MTEPTEVLDAPQLPAVQTETQFPANQVIESGLPPAIRTAVRSHVIIWTVILSIGPLGLPLLWLSPKYSIWMKVLISFLTLFFTIILPIAVTIYCGEFLVRSIVDAMEQANSAGGAL